MARQFAFGFRTPDLIDAIEFPILRRFSYQELWSRCGRLVSVLKNAGAEAGDRIAILAANSPMYIEAYLAVPAAAFVIVPLNTRHAEPELWYALDDAGVKILLADRDPDGTTSVSKGVMLSHRNLISNTFHFLTTAPSDEANVTLIMAPLFHAAGSNGVLGAVWCGRCQIPIKVLAPALALDLIAEHDVTHTLGVPAMIAAIAETQLKTPRDASSVVMVAHGGSPIPTEVVRREARSVVRAVINRRSIEDCRPERRSSTDRQRG